MTSCQGLMLQLVNRLKSSTVTFLCKNYKISILRILTHSMRIPFRMLTKSLSLSDLQHLHSNDLRQVGEQLERSRKPGLRHRHALRGK